MRFYFFRHSIWEPAAGKALSQAGLMLARQVGEQHLHDRGITRVIVSKEERTRQTALAMLEGAGQSLSADCFIVNELCERSQAWDVKADLLSLGFSEHDRILAIGHGCSLEMLLEHLTKRFFPKLKECDCAIVDCVDGKFTLVEEIRR